MLTQSKSLLTEHDVYLFKEGKHYRLYQKLGSHLIKNGAEEGVLFAVWAPNAKDVSVIGDFNYWTHGEYTLNPRWDSSGIWEGFIPGLKQGTLYKYVITTNEGRRLEKADPFAFFCEIPPSTASIVWNLEYGWKPLKNQLRNGLDEPIAIYEMHVGSWREDAQTYTDLAAALPQYLQELGFTHVEFLPIMEHPFKGSWGYQVTGFFAPTSRYGTPQDFMRLIEALHEKGIGVILDWVPSHFPSDPHGLHRFDGTYLFEHEDPKKGFHPDWSSYIFNYGRHEVKSFLISSALFWLDRYQVDGIRVDAVASMLYLDYSRKQGEWIPNQFGGNENLDAISFIKELNEAIYLYYPEAQTFAEESTAWPMVSRPTYLGGLGFGMKWNMGWMHDTLVYFSKDSLFRKFHHHDLLFSLVYAFHENFILPLSHDEVVHGKKALLAKMPGDPWQKFANVRLLIGYMMTHPGKKLLFMGIEIGQWSEWSHDAFLDWHLLAYEHHAGLHKWMRDLMHFYKTEPALYRGDFDGYGFEWADISDWEHSIVSYFRRSGEDQILVVCNLTPTPRENYLLGVPKSGVWREVLNSDSHYYGGSDKGNLGKLKTVPVPSHGKEHSLTLMLPPLGFLCFKM